MKHRLYLPTFLPVSFPDSMETFLEDMAKKGWFLKKVGYFLSFCQFEKGAPAPVRYRLEPIPDTVRTPSAEMVQFYEEFGWKYIDNRSEHLVVYGTDDFSLPELHTDAELQLETLGKLQKKCLRRALLVFCLFPLWLLLHISAGNWLFNDFASANSTSNLDVNAGNLPNFAQYVKETGFTGISQSLPDCRRSNGPPL